MRGSIPKRFEGTDDEIRANRATHHFIDTSGDGDARCMRCDSRPSHAAADYPCGAEVPRLTCNGEWYDVNPDDPSEGTDLRHDHPCPLHTHDDVLDLTEAPDPLVTDEVRANVLENLRR